MSDRGNHPLVTESRKGRKGNIYYGHKEIRGWSYKLTGTKSEMCGFQGILSARDEVM